MTCKTIVVALTRLTLAAELPSWFDAGGLNQAEGLRGRPQLLRVGVPAFTQGSPAESVFFLQDGIVKLSVSSPAGRDAVVGILGPEDFFGEGCLAGQALRMSTATAIEPCSVVQIPSSQMSRALHEHAEFSDRFLARILARNIRIEEDLIDQMFNSSEKRLARALLLLGRYDKSGDARQTLPKLSQETLAEMIGTTRSRVNYFMNKFRKLGLIEYNGHLTIHSAQLRLVLND